MWAKKKKASIVEIITCYYIFLYYYQRRFFLAWKENTLVNLASLKCLSSFNNLATGEIYIL